MTDSAVIDYYLHRAALQPANIIVPYILVSAAWNPADKDSNITLSNSNRTATSGGSDGAVRANLFKTAGKWYFEVVTSGAMSDQFSVGVATSTASLTTPSVTGQYIGQNSGGTFITYGNGVLVNGAGAYSFVADTLGFSVDVGAGKLWIYSKNNGGIYIPDGGGVSGDPTTGANPTLTFTPGLSVTPFAYLPNAGTPNVAVINGGQVAFVNPKSTGYNAWQA